MWQRFCRAINRGRPPTQMQPYLNTRDTIGSLPGQPGLFENQGYNDHNEVILTPYHRHDQAVQAVDNLELEYPRNAY